MNPNLPPDYGDRRRQLREAVNRGWLLLYKGPEHFHENLYYLTGLDSFYTLSLISLETDHEYVLTNPMEYPSVRADCLISDIIPCPPDELLDHATRILKNHKVSLLYLDYGFLSRTPAPLELADRFRSRLPGLTIQAVPEPLWHLRQIKEPGEIAILRQGRRLIAELFNVLPAMIRPGVAEAEIAAEIYHYLVRHGFNKFYDIMVASGANSAFPIYRQNQGRLPAQGVVVIDICAALNYYVCDLTRTFPAGGFFTPKQEKLYSLILQIQKEVIGETGAGVSLDQLSRLAENRFARHGLDEYYLKKIGHFVGLAPDDPGTPDTRLQPGMVITIEPGLYLPAECLGLRVEDMVIID